MAKPPRDAHATTSNTYFVTARTWEGRALFQTERLARLFLDTLYHYRAEDKFALHEFVLMPNHFHLLFTTGPGVTLERAMQFVKGGFSRRARIVAGRLEIWQRGYVDHRVRDAVDFARHREYIRQNPVRARLCERPEGYPYSSAYPGSELDMVPQRLKPL